MSSGSSQIVKLLLWAIAFLIVLSACVSLVEAHPTALAGIALILILVAGLRILWQRTSL